MNSRQKRRRNHAVLMAERRVRKILKKIAFNVMTDGPFGKYLRKKMQPTIDNALVVGTGYFNGFSVEEEFDYGS